MKKILITLFSISLFFTNSSVFWFWINFEESWFYSSIDSSVSDLESQILTIDIVWENWTKDAINKITWDSCLENDLSEDQIKNILYNWAVNLIINNISDSCFKNWSVSQTTINNHLKAIRQFYNEKSFVSKEKTKQIFWVSNVWIYSDWIKSNAPFDLIEDLKNIDSIIFMEESTQYEWNEDHDLWGELSWLINKINEDNNIAENQLINNSETNNNWENNSVKKDLPKDETVEEISINSINACYISNSDSWLNNEALNFLLLDTKKKNTPKTEDELTEIELDLENKIKNIEESNFFEPTSSYSKVNDNSEFPCDWFFCIDINFITYQHNLLWWWFQDITIEYIITRSNEHLKKFTNTSLVQSKMSMNNFELWLKDLNLPDVFHIWFQISTKPVPILSIEDEGREDEWVYSTENQLKAYYEAYWLDYKRRNDLSLYSKIVNEKQAIENTSLSNNKEVLWQIEAYSKYLTEKKKKKEIITKAINEQSKHTIMSDFESQFKEIEVFNKAINDYVNNLDTIITNMDKIPSDTWSN